MKALRIIKWNEVHEDRLSRRVKYLQYVQMPTNRDSDGWATLGILPGGAAAKGIYLELCELAATMPVRGLLVEKGTPMSRIKVARRCRCTPKELDAALELLMHEEVAFIDEIENDDVDDRLILTTTKAGRVVSQIILPHHQTDQGEVLDPAGNPVEHPNKADADSVDADTESEETDTGSRGDGHRSSENSCAPKNNGNGNGKENEKYIPARRAQGAPTGGGGADEVVPDNFSYVGVADAVAEDFETARGKGLTKWQMVTASMVGVGNGAKQPANSPRAHSDRGQLLSTFALAWPEDPDEAGAITECRNRLNELLALVKQARSRKVPLQWLRGCAKKRWGEGTRTAESRRERFNQSTMGATV